MKTPIIDFVKAYKKRGCTRAHMPGHKGKAFLGAEAFDITEISGADELYSAKGIIKKSMQNAAELFGTAATFYSTEGSTLAIKAMLATALEDKEKTRVLAARNVHKAFIYAAAELDFEVEWLYGVSDSICECNITAEQVDAALKEGGFYAVYITSPDYLGNIADVKGISSVCEKYGVPLLVDNAHGAYLKFLEKSAHPIELGAAMCADSAHKTLPVLTGGAYLHISKKYAQYVNVAAKKLPIFASTSPSYLILQSLDLCNKYLKKYKTEYQICAKRVVKIKNTLKNNGFLLLNTEPLKITVDAAKMGYSGYELCRIFEGRGVIPEFADEDYLVLMLSPQNGERDFRRIAKIKAEKRVSRQQGTAAPAKGKQAVSVRRAVFAKSERAAVRESVGRICAAPTVSCPPAVPIIISGELIDGRAVELLEKYGVEFIEVIADEN
ncbi:MAG: aminotransferase class V-fold PLP-dependent enzyme [Clostridia bacterium]|nr:aminotransferase class V-fold PLP-dependent enzyme [Clostridia bacterium]